MPGGRSGACLESGMMDSALDSLPLFETFQPSRKPPVSAAGKLCFSDIVKDFCQFGQPSAELTEGGIPYLVNEFWTSGQRQAHSIHEISYRACFKAQLPEFFIQNLTKPGDAVYDPFMGRGTTPVQAALMGRRPVGNDVNPLSVLLTRPRLTVPNLTAIAKRLDQIKWDNTKAEDSELLAFYSPQTLSHINALRSWLIEQAPINKIPNGAFARVLFCLYPAAEPSCVRAVSEKDQRTAGSNSAGS